MPRSSRRKVIVGLAALLGGSGAAVGSGAFTTVESQRDVSIETAGDDGALLSLVPAGSETIVEVGEDDLLGFDIDNLNRDARTTFRPAFAVTNNGSNEVAFYVESQTDVGDGEILNFQENGSEDSIVGSDNSITLSSEGGSAAIDLEIDLIDETHGNLEAIDTVTLVATAT